MPDDVVVDSLWLRLFGTTVRWYDAGGIRTRVIEAGEGPPLLLVHGITGQAESFARNIMPLAKHFHVYAMDLIGHGLSDKPLDVDYSIERYLQHVVDFIEAADIAPAHVVGQSLGGWIGCWLAIKHPGHVGKLVLDTSAGLRATSTAEDAQRGSRIVRDNALRAVKEPTQAGIRRQMTPLMADPAALTDEIVALRRAVFQRADAQRAMPKILDDLALGASAGLTPDRLEQITSPTLLVWGRHNRGTTWEEAKAAATMMPDAELHVVDGAAHWPQWEQADEFNDVVERWLLGRARR